MLPSLVRNHRSRRDTKRGIRCPVRKTRRPEPTSTRPHHTVHPVTGQPFSDKSKIVAALSQLLGLISIVGIGRDGT
jgi:hypothetical protein